MESSAATTSRSLLSSQLTTSYLSDTSTSGHYFDIKAKTPIILNGIDINSAQDVGTNSPIEIYVKSGSYDGYTSNSTSWLLWANRLLTNTSGVDAPTFISIPPININTDGRRSFYIHCTANNDCLRYDSTSHNTTLRVYQNQHVMLYREGITKVSRDTWDGELSNTLSVFSGGLSYDVVTQSPTKMPTLRPSKSPSLSPTVSIEILCISCVHFCKSKHFVSNLLPIIYTTTTTAKTNRKSINITNTSTILHTKFITSSN